MNSSASLNSDGFTASAAIRSANGSRASASEPATDRHQPKPSTKSTSHSGQARSLGHSFTSGTKNGRRRCSMGCSIRGPFVIQTNGGIGQTVTDADGNAVAWTTEPWVAQVICRVMNENEGLLVAVPRL